MENVRCWWKTISGSWKWETIGKGEAIIKGKMLKRENDAKKGGKGFKHISVENVTRQHLELNRAVSYTQLPN